METSITLERFRCEECRIMEYELIEAGDDRCALAPRRDGGVPQDMSLDKPDRPFIEPHGSHWPRRDAPAMTQMGEE